MAQENAESVSEEEAKATPMSPAELDFLEEHNQAVIDWMREFSDANPAKQRKMLGWDKSPDEKADAAINSEWISLTPMVRVLVEMPEDHAMMMRLRLAQARKEHGQSILEIDSGQVYKGEVVMAKMEIHIREILIYG